MRKRQVEVTYLRDHVQVLDIPFLSSHRVIRQLSPSYLVLLSPADAYEPAHLSCPRLFSILNILQLSHAHVTSVRPQAQINPPGHKGNHN